MDSPRGPWKSAVVVFFLTFLVQKKTGPEEELLGNGNDV